MIFRMVKKSGQIFLPLCHNARVCQTDRQTDGQTDRQTEISSLDRVCIPCSAVKRSLKDWISECITVKQASLDASSSKCKSLRRRSAFGLAVTLAFDLWPWKSYQQCPVTWLTFVPSFCETPPLSREISRNVKYVLTDDRTDNPKTRRFPPYYCWSLAEAYNKHIVSDTN